MIPPPPFQAGFAEENISPGLFSGGSPCRESAAPIRSDAGRSPDLPAGPGQDKGRSRVSWWSGERGRFPPLPLFDIPDLKAFFALSAAGCSSGWYVESILKPVFFQ